MRDYGKRNSDIKNRSDIFSKKWHLKEKSEQVKRDGNLISEAEKVVEKAIKQKQKKQSFRSNKERIIYILGFLTCLTLVLTSYLVVLFNR